MTTLAMLTPNLAELSSAIFRRVDGDATLEGSTYLTGSGRIIPAGRAPVTIEAPRLHIEPQIAVPDPYTVATRVTVDFRAVVKNPSDAVHADFERMGRILQRVGQLVTGRAVFSGAGLKFGDSWLQIAASPIIYDPNTPEEASQVLRAVIRYRQV